MDILLRVEGEWLVVEIIDNGIGRAAAGAVKGAMQASKGMEITNRRIKEFNKEREASVVITDLYDEQQRPAGTRVVVRMRRVKKEKDA